MKLRNTEATAPPSLFGEVNKSPIFVNNILFPTLLDTGSTVSSITETGFRLLRESVRLYPVKDILRVECANGQMLQYLGYTEVNLRIPTVQGVELPALLLVVPDTPSGIEVPILLGTNVLMALKEKFHDVMGDEQVPNLNTAWQLTLHSLSAKSKQMDQGRIGILKCASTGGILLKRNETITVPGKVVPGKCFRSCLAMVHPSDRSTLPDGAEIMPVMIDCKGGETDVPVEISNLTNRPLRIEPSQLLCELQEVEVEDAKHKEQPQLSHEDFINLFDFTGCNISEIEMNLLRSLLIDYQDIFSQSDFDIGHTTTFKHNIKLTDDLPFKQRHRRIPPGMMQEVRDHLAELLRAGIIQESFSPFASAIVLVRKKNNQLRFCVDYRQLNAKTIKDSYALPRIDEMLDNLSGNSYFSSLDLRMGYYQVEMAEEDKYKSAFTAGPLGFYHWNRMPFGLTNAPSTFQRLMERVLGDIYLKECFCFLDDLNVPSKDFSGQLSRLQHVFDRIRLHGLKLAPHKCKLCQEKCTFCGQ